MSVLGRLVRRALGAPAPVRARLGGRFDGAGPVVDPEVPAEEAAPLAIRAPAPDALSAAAASPRKPAMADATDRHISFEPVQPSATPPRAVAMTRSDVGEQVEALMQTAAVAVRPPHMEDGRRDDATAPISREKAAATLAESPPAKTPEPFRPLLPPVEGRPAAPRPLASPATADTRDIRISIGRIEVRGEPARRGPPTPAAPPPSRLMSLEDYLGKARRR